MAGELGIELAADEECNLVLYGASRSVTIRRVTLYKVDDVRWLDPDEAMSAALSLFMADQ